MAATNVQSAHNQDGHIGALKAAPVRNNKQVLRPISFAKRHLNRRDREMAIASQLLRQNQPYLTTQETTAYRYSFKHNLCLDMLQTGFHKSFHELFDLLKQQADERERAGPDSVEWTEVQLQHENDKLERLKDGLTLAELAERNGTLSEEYSSRYDLATYFMQRGDMWLAEHFFQTCLEISMNDQENGQIRAEGHSNVGLRCQERGNDLQAAYHFEECYKLTSETKDWLNRNGSKMHSDACVHLCNIYAKIGDTIGRNNFVDGVVYSQKAYDIAKESNDRKRIAESGYKLGLAYGKIDDFDMSLKYLREFLDQCQRQNDVNGIGRACDAIASIYREQGHIDKCIEYLHIFVSVAENSKNEEAYSKACRNLGSIFNYMGEYDEATENFGKSYNLSRSANDYHSINVNRVLFGISMAHNMMGRCAEHVTSVQPASVACLSEWKSARTDNFSGSDDADGNETGVDEERMKDRDLGVTDEIKIVVIDEEETLEHGDSQDSPSVH